MKFKAFSTLDLIVVIGLVLVLGGASLLTYARVVKKQNDTTKIALSNELMSLVNNYHKTNFGSYPVSIIGEAPSSSYSSVVVNGPDSSFLNIYLGKDYEKITENNLSSDLVYVFRNDGKEAAVVVRSLAVDKKKCNTSSSELPQIIGEYLSKDPTACYFLAN